MCYGVISLQVLAHLGSMENLLGPDASDDLVEELSADVQVTSAVSILSCGEGAASAIAVAASRVVVERCAPPVDDDVVGDSEEPRAKRRRVVSISRQRRQRFGKDLTSRVRRRLGHPEAADAVAIDKVEIAGIERGKGMGILLGLGNQPRIIVKRPDGCVRFWRWSLSKRDSRIFRITSRP